VEKRRFDRFDFQKSAQVFPVLPSKSGNIYEVQKDPIEAWVNDISEGGVRLEVVHSFASDALLKLNFELEKNKTVETYGKIVWSHDNHSGIHFMMADHRLRKDIKAIGRKNDI
jgi:hypothetical protein